MNKMRVPTDYVEKEYGFDKNTVCVSVGEVKNTCKNAVPATLDCIILTFDEACKKFDLSPDQMRLTYGVTWSGDKSSKVNIPYDAPEGTTLKTLKEDLLELIEKSKGSHRKAIVQSKWRDRHYETIAEFDSFAKLEDPTKNIMLSHIAPNFRDNVVEDLKLYADLGAGGILMTQTELALELTRNNRINVGVDPGMMIYYKGASKSEIERRAQEIRDTVIAGSPIRVESGRIMALDVQRTKVNDRVVAVRFYDAYELCGENYELQPNGNLLCGYEPGKRKTIPMTKAPAKIQLAFTGKPMLKIFSDASDLPTSEFKDLLITKKSDVEYLEAKFAWAIA